jgi:hypothetical protein
MSQGTLQHKHRWYQGTTPQSLKHIATEASATAKSSFPTARLWGTTVLLAHPYFQTLFASIANHSRQPSRKPDAVLQHSHQ